jgi:hypothetical protein
MPDHPQKITFGEMREMGVRGLLIYCADYRCSHSIAVSAGHLPYDVRLSDIEARFVCPAHGNWNRQPTAMMAISRPPHWRGSSCQEARACRSAATNQCRLSRTQVHADGWPDGVRLSDIEGASSFVVLRTAEPTALRTAPGSDIVIRNLIRALRR